jgi:hypothetical protein
MAMKTMAKQFGFGTWNVRIMLRSGEKKQLIYQIKQYNIHVRAIQETRWQGEAIIDLKTHTATDWELHSKKGVWSSFYSRQ